MIQFYVPRQFYGCFSNFSLHKVVFNDKTWPTSEHAYQAQKTDDASLKEIIRACPTAKEATRFGRTIDIRPDWEQTKYGIMRDIVRAKVEQHPSIKSLLLSTGVQEIVEASPKDYIWGCGKDGTGTNWLGKIFMGIREKLKNKEK